MNLQINIGVDDVGPYLIHSRREIIALLRRLTEKRELVRMIFSEGEEAIATAVLEVNDDSVIIDSAPDAGQLARVLASSSISFDTALERVRVAFFTTRVEPCVHDGLPALRIPLPETMVRLQRREYYRVLTPRCSIQIEQEDGLATDRLASFTAAMICFLSNPGRRTEDRHALAPRQFNRRRPCGT